MAASRAARLSSTTPDVRRMLMTMRCLYRVGCRGMASGRRSLRCRAHHHPDAQVRKDNAAFYEFMVLPVLGYSTE